MNPKNRFAILASGLLLAATQAGAITLNFDGLAVGTALSNQYAAQGAVFSANAFSGAGSSSSGKDWATNTDMTIVSSTGADVGGLGTPALVSGNVLRSFNGWLGEDGDPSFTITFSGIATGFSATFAGVTTPTDVTMWAYNGTVLAGSVSGTTAGQFVLSFAGSLAMTSVAIRPGSFSDWVGVDNITYTLAPIPEASSYAMMGLGVALLAFKRRRQG